MRVGVYVTPIEMSQIIKGIYGHTHCWCERQGLWPCKGHLSPADVEASRAVGPYVWASIEKLRAQGHRVEYVLARPVELARLYVPGSRFRQLAVDRFHTIEP